ncbi:MAG: transglutaminase family protein [Gammaproteobacteria bacterium]|nr:transglutaminase family protein [Gammaproteobacteria bacterium]MBQ0839360.1 transglutaminase family protein [Gammaproteobacteria bacterium]
MNKYLDASAIIDWQQPAVLAKAVELANECDGDEAIAQACFNFVRDEIKHSLDYKRNPVTCSASQVLQHGTGYCYAKSHLLVALLRANSIPAGLCYQRLTIDHSVPPFCLHGLVAVYLKKHAWYRIDPRGNKPGVAAQFCPPQEKLAFPIIIEGEADLPEIWPEPLEIVVEALRQGRDYLDVANNLPDLELIFT